MKNRVTLIFLFAAMLFSQTLFAQPETESVSKFNWGMKLGLNFSDFSGEDAGTVDMKSGLALGFFFRYNINNFLSAQTELIYSEKGAMEVVEIDSIDVDYVYRINYFDIPIIVNLTIPLGENSTIRPRLFGGPVFSLNVSATLKGIIDQNNEAETQLDNIEVIEVGVTYGAALDFKIAETMFGIELRFANGLTSLNSSGYDIKNDLYSVTFTYVF